ncbi:uncharacterized protein LOC143401801 [Callospermophilus lateralis]|uniref:uncharacterized protein LOC143401801 n=1 Tax=Callospermophilus lateralis TaxID=76772 RepID=UPI004038F0F7
MVPSSYHLTKKDKEGTHGLAEHPVGLGGGRAESYCACVVGSLGEQPPPAPPAPPPPPTGTGCTRHRLRRHRLRPAPPPTGSACTGHHLRLAPPPTGTACPGTASDRHRLPRTASDPHRLAPPAPAPRCVPPPVNMEAELERAAFLSKLWRKPTARSWSPGASENESLWKEVSELRAKHAKQQQVI